MAAQDAVVLENHLKLFVETKVGETISLEFSTGHIYIKPDKKQGSITLGSFWVRVIQAYFPSPDFTYKKSYSSSHGSEVLTTAADGYAIKIYLRTGLVVVEGDVVYEWFKVIFRKVIQHYDRNTYSQYSDYRSDQLMFDARRETQRKEKTVLFLDSSHPEIVDERLALMSSDVRMSELEGRFSEDADDCERSNRNGHCNQLVVQENSDVSFGASISLRDGNTHIYPLWRQLLNKWLSVHGCKVYICTRHMDVQRYKDLTVMAYKNRLHTGLEAVYTSALSGAQMTEVKHSLMKGHSAEEQLFIEYRILNKTKLATTKHISCNFVAGAYPNQPVELMVTSATFDEEGLGRSQNLHTLSLSKISMADFQSDFLDKLATL